MGEQIENPLRARSWTRETPFPGFWVQRAWIVFGLLNFAGVLALCVALSISYSVTRDQGREIKKLKDDSIKLPKHENEATSLLAKEYDPLFRYLQEYRQGYGAYPNEGLIPKYLLESEFGAVRLPPNRKKSKQSIHLTFENYESRRRLDARSTTLLLPSATYVCALNPSHKTMRWFLDKY